MINFLKRQTIKILLILMLIIPKCSFSQPISFLQNNSEVTIVDNKSSVDLLTINKDFEVSVDIHKEKERYRFNIDTACLDLFDYSILKGHLLSIEEEFKARIAIEKKICDDSIDLLTEKHKESSVFFKKEITKLNNEILDIKDLFKKKEEIYKEELKIWKWSTIGVSSASLILLYALIK